MNYFHNKSTVDIETIRHCVPDLYLDWNYQNFVCYSNCSFVVDILNNNYNESLNYHQN